MRLTGRRRDRESIDHPMTSLILEPFPADMLKDTPSDLTPTRSLDSESILQGRYKLGKRLGAGAMGEVFEAEQLSTGQLVAVKTIRAEATSREGMRRRFDREGSVIAELQHPNIVRLLDMGHDEMSGVTYLVMEHVAGTSLGELLYGDLTPKRVNVAVALHIASQLCSALTEPHHKGIVHRDIKPDNVMLQVRSDEHLDVKLLDFGVAHIASSRRPASQASIRLTATGCIVGTPHYLAPELCQSGRHASARSDLYAVGAMLHEMISGAPPFQGRTVTELLFKQVHEPAPRLPEGIVLNQQLEGELNALLEELMSKQASLRPTSALEVKRRIDALCVEYDLRVWTDRVVSLASIFEPTDLIGLMEETEPQAPYSSWPPPRETLDRAHLTSPGEQTRAAAAATSPPSAEWNAPSALSVPWWRSKSVYAGAVAAWALVACGAFAATMLSERAGSEGDVALLATDLQAAPPTLSAPPARIELAAEQGDGITPATTLSALVARGREMVQVGLRGATPQSVVVISKLEARPSPPSAQEPDRRVTTSAPPPRGTGRQDDGGDARSSAPAPAPSEVIPDAAWLYSD